MISDITFFYLQCIHDILYAGFNCFNIAPISPYYDYTIIICRMTTAFEKGRYFYFGFQVLGKVGKCMFVSEKSYIRLETLQNVFI